MPSLAMLFGQKSARESIQATDFYLHLRYLINGPAKPPVTFNRGIATFGGGTTGILPKVLGASTAARTARVEAGTLAVCPDGKQVICIFVLSMSMIFLYVVLLMTAGLLPVVYFCIKASHKRHKERLDIIDRDVPKVPDAFDEITRLFNYGHYITESERINLENKYSDLFYNIGKIVKTKELKDSPNKEIVDRFYKALSDTSGYKKVNNERFIANQLDCLKEYFDTVLPYPLDPQQREAILSLEDNVLVISSAGSGKTMTTVGKVRYLIDIQKVDPSRILLITFTRKAAESLSERLGEKNLKCRTFHKLALEIIADTTGEKPTITSADFSARVYHKLFDESSSFRQAIADYIVDSRYSMKDQFEYSSMEDYIQARKREGVQSFYRDMDGHPVFCKSNEEGRICDFLGSRGVAFRYEEKYEHPTLDDEYRQYCPDFSIYFTDKKGLRRRIYLEHFAVNSQGNCPSWFTQDESSKYMEGISWKRNLHKKNGTILLETTSADFNNGSVFEILTRQLMHLGVTFSYANKEYLSREMVRQEDNILGILTAFIFLLKSRNTPIKAIEAKVLGTSSESTFTRIFKPFVEEYRKMEEAVGEIDFTDAIIKATNLCNNGYRPEYDYILVDEFQDISLDRYHFLQSLRHHNPLTKLFCVGDDWQSIYRFAGSDMALFKSFDKYFGYTKRCLMETTYRFGEPTIKKSSKFILSNPEQAEKNVRSFKSNSETMLDFAATDNNIPNVVKSLLDSIPLDKEVLVIGRYSFDVKVLQSEFFKIKTIKDHSYILYGNRKMDYLTVHQSKGLESDYVILLNCNAGTLGFPSNISDSPILDNVLSEPDKYEYSEERRIFYVAITRAKTHTWVLYDNHNPSPFISEFIKVKVDKDELNAIPTKDLCPKCHCGRLVEKKRGVAVNGNPFTTYTCSNSKYGCDYYETVFVNLNSKRRRS